MGLSKFLTFLGNDDSLGRRGTQPLSRLTNLLVFHICSFQERVRLQCSTHRENLCRGSFVGHVSGKKQETNYKCIFSLFDGFCKRLLKQRLEHVNVAPALLGVGLLWLLK